MLRREGPRSGGGVWGHRPEHARARGPPGPPTQAEKTLPSARLSFLGAGIGRPLTALAPVGPPAFSYPKVLQTVLSPPSPLCSPGHTPGTCPWACPKRRHLPGGPSDPGAAPALVSWVPRAGFPCSAHLLQEHPDPVPTETTGVPGFRDTCTPRPGAHQCLSAGAQWHLSQSKALPPPLNQAHHNPGPGRPLLFQRGFCGRGTPPCLSFAWLSDPPTLPLGSASVPGDGSASTDGACTGGPQGSTGYTRVGRSPPHTHQWGCAWPRGPAPLAHLQGHLRH